LQLIPTLRVKKAKIRNVTKAIIACKCDKLILSDVGFEVFMAVTMENALFWDINTQFLLQRRHIVSPLLIPAGYFYVRFEVFMEGHYEECHLLVYKNPVHTSQKTYYFSATETSRLILCKN
jgi:hypothetical protein